MYLKRNHEELSDEKEKKANELLHALRPML